MSSNDSPAAAVPASAAQPVRRRALALGAIGASVLLAAGAASAQAALPDTTLASIVGPNVIIFDPTMPQSQIQSTVDAIAAQQITNQFGPQRYAIFFKPGTYGSAASPLNFQVGYYTSVAGLGQSPDDVVINGSINVYNQCDTSGSCIALNNFWRSLSNLTVNVAGQSGCYASGMFWAVSQAAPMRRVHVNGGNLTLMDYCSGPSFASGGFIADARTGFIINGSQQQFLVRDSSIGGWSNGVWNQVFSGVAGAPATCFPGQAACGGPYTTVATSAVSRGAPYPYVDADGRYRVFVPAAQTDSAGASWGAGTQTPGRSLPIERFFIARPAYPAVVLNAALAFGFNLILTPGVYRLDQPLHVVRAGTVVLGVGFPTLIPTRGNAALTVADVPGVKLAGLMVDAGPVNSPVLMRLGTPNAQRSDPADPTTLSDVFFRIGGAAAGKASVSLVVNSDHVLLDDIWAWRADHGNGVGWNVNTADTGVIVNGDDVTAYGLFVEHYQKHEVLWNGERGSVTFFQNEMPYDPPSQAAWMQAPTVYGWSALKVADGVTRFTGRGMGSYSFFNQGLDIFAANAFEVPGALPPGSLQGLLTIFLDAVNGRGGILNVVNGVGGASTIANPDVPVTVPSYP